MNFKGTYLILLIFLFRLNSMIGQQLKLGFGVSPQLSWLTSNDISVRGKSVTTGFGMGINSELELKYNWKIVAGANLSFHQGGRLKYLTGGNLWKNADLKLPALNSGYKPIPDNTYLQYETKFWSLAAGIKRTISESENTKFYFEFPKFNLARVFGARGAIISDELLTNEENIIEELNPLQFGLSGGFGIENRIGRNNYWYANLEYLKTITDLTKNDGVRAVQTSTGDPTTPLDDTYRTFPDLTRVSLNVLSIRIGVLF